MPRRDGAGRLVRHETDKPGGRAAETPRRLIASNKKARHEYEILKTYEAGLVLLGTEVKSLRLGHASLVDAFAQERDGELHLYGLHIAEYGLHGWSRTGPGGSASCSCTGPRSTASSTRSASRG